MPKRPLTHEVPDLLIESKLSMSAQVGPAVFVDQLPKIEDHRPGQILIEFLPTADRDAVFGLFIERWDSVERLMGTLLHFLLETDRNTAETVFASYNGMKQTADALKGLAGGRLRREMQLDLKRLLGRVQKVSTKRNKIIHGHWQMRVTANTVRTPHGVVFRQTSGEWRRIYRPVAPKSQPETTTAASGKQTNVDELSVADLLGVIETMDALLKDFRDFVDGLLETKARVRPSAHPPQ